MSLVNPHKLNSLFLKNLLAEAEAKKDWDFADAVRYKWNRVREKESEWEIHRMTMFNVTLGAQIAYEKRIGLR